MSRKTPYTKVEVVEERHPNQPENTPCVKMNTVLINGQPVLVEKDSITINPGDATETATVELTLLVDEVSIRQVPNGYTDGISEWEVELLAEQQRKVDQVVEHFDDGHMRFTAKPQQPRDHLGRFTKRKSHYSDYLTDD